MGSVAILFDKGSAKDGAAYVGLLSAESGFQVPPHRHADETELLYVLQGGGTMTVAGQQLPVRRGTAVQIPPDVEHSFIVESKAPVLAVQFYTPSGPEQRFKKAK
jgi:quercetin dioxygenase-like cupin family protein